MSRRRASVALVVAFAVALAAVPGLDGVAPQGRHAADWIDLRDPFEPDRAEGSGANADSGPSDQRRERLAAGLDSIRATELHERGVTGDGAAVGVIGSGFAPEHWSIGENVTTHRRTGASADGSSETAHDTAVAEVVTRTAPDADLYLVSVGTEPAPGQYAEAVEWLVANDVDVIVDSGSYFPPTMEGMEEIADAADDAADEGVVFVTSAGNYADRHWAGSADDGGWVAFDSGVEANPLDGGAAVEGRVAIRLYWDSPADYDLYLYRHVPDRSDPVVAKSIRRQAENDSAPTSESIDVGVPRGTYYVAIHAHEGIANDATLRLFSAHQSLGYATPEGSFVAPATGESVIAVGAFDAESGAVRAYSSRGGTVGGASVDIGAPDGVETAVSGRFYGTSAAAPFVAGTAALMTSNADDLSPAETRRILRRTADESHGTKRLDALAAVRAASDGDAAVDPSGSEPASIGTGANAVGDEGTEATAPASAC
ncbi:S8 family serine peptidase [Halegenticoccus tardaugens]|uniref:S8 family serine peptidase n=1 Tax=Halegenticoccus tardaugens TaxID=2071624 RepID=UPI00100ACBB8|nr:S8 family serine peptidase [Halegenticoccus tardaugens]